MSFDPAFLSCASPARKAFRKSDPAHLTAPLAPAIPTPTTNTRWIVRKSQGGERKLELLSASSRLLVGKSQSLDTTRDLQDRDLVALT